MTRVQTGRKGYMEIGYQITRLSFQFTEMFGRGSQVWVGRGEQDQRNYAIKAAWIDGSIPGKEPEGVILQHIKDKGITKGVVQLVHYQEIRLYGERGPVDGVFSNRKVSKLTSEQRKTELIHTWLSLTPYAEIIDSFKTSKALLLAFYDALRGLYLSGFHVVYLFVFVPAYWEFYQVAGILHRDISINNILLNPRGADGNRVY
ncbi:hypothetical protein M422DRAFT_47950 [Sphaerobolus stellatus SS14]|uniref:Protein kinase domain-containing protein n=1 Tax=Sphaerobolus stellatus (strain SS14) TaxID=990650 RepID=A0A0C9UJV4_SPHS4|nr:hypothetical protein M422DRAFT_47950 [Sphaerobolus stellatus SS14]